MTDILLFVAIVTMIGVNVFLIFLLMEIRKISASLRKTTEYNLNPMMDELQLTMKSVRGITDTINDVTEDFKQVSHSIGEIGNTISSINRLVGETGTSASVKAKSIRAGALAALQYLLTNLFRKGEEK